MAVSVRDVAARAGVAVGTVSNVLNHPERVSQEVRDRVLAAIDELDFVPNDAARQLRSGKSASIGLIVTDLRNPFFTDVARGAENRATADGLAVTLGNSDVTQSRQTAYLDLFERQRVQGVLITPYGDVHDQLVRLRKRGTPVVLIGRGVKDQSFSIVSDDDLAGGQLAAEHLLQQGRRRILFVGAQSTNDHISDRQRGAQAAVDRVEGASLEIIDLDNLSIEAGRAAGTVIAARPVAERPDAIFAANDLVAIGLLNSLVVEARIEIPREIAVIGYDDIDYASAAVVPLSSIRQPSALIGQTAVEILLEEASNPEAEPCEMVFTPELVVRKSTSS